MYIKTELTNRQQFRLFCTPIDNSKLAYQIATLLPILLKNGIDEKQQVKVAKSLFMNNKIDNIELQSCPMEDSEDSLWLQIKQEKEEAENLVCPLEEFEDLTEAALLNK